MDEYQKLLEEYGVKSYWYKSFDSVELMIANLIGEYDSRTIDEKKQELEDDLHRLVRYQVGDLKINGIENFSKYFFLPDGALVNSAFCSGLRLTPHNTSLLKYTFVKDSNFNYKTWIKYYKEEAPEEIEKISPGYLVKRIFAEQQAEFEAIKKYSKLIDDFIEYQQNNPFLIQMSSKMKELMRKRFASMEYELETLRNEARI